MNSSKPKLGSLIPSRTQALVNAAVCCCCSLSLDSFSNVKQRSCGTPDYCKITSMRMCDLCIKISGVHTILMTKFASRLPLCTLKSEVCFELKAEAIHNFPTPKKVKEVLVGWYHRFIAPRHALKRSMSCGYGLGSTNNHLSI